MNAFRIFPIESAASVLAFAAASERVVADEKPGFPCRVCLRDASPGEELVLASFSPFRGHGPYRATGPIFVHPSCAPHEPTDELPEILRARPLSLRAYDAGERLLVGALTEGGRLTADVERLLTDPEVAELHVHFARPGCYACRIVRS